MSPLFRVLLCSSVFCAFTSVSRADFTVSPSSLAHDDPTPVMLGISPLAPEQTVLVERYHDANANGAVDEGELLLLSFLVTDGRVEMFGGVRDENVVGDDDEAINGEITVTLRLNALPEVNRVVGNYLFRVVALDESFMPMTRPFVVTQSAQGQFIHGTVLANGAPLPGAIVAALVSAGDGEDFAAGVVADGSGVFTLNLPAGDYMLLALKPGFVASFNNMPQVSLGSGLSVTQNVTVASASRTISGRVVDAVTSIGVPGVQLFAESSDGEAALMHTDMMGNFSMGVSAAQWSLNASEQALRFLGYRGEDQMVDTTSGDVTGLNIPLNKGRGQLELVFFFPSGTFGGGTSGSMGFPTQLHYYYALFNLEDINFPTNVFFTGPSGSGLSDTPSAVFGANYDGDSAWYSSPQVNVAPFPPGGIYTVNYKGQPMDYVLPEPQAQNRQVLLVPRVTLDGQDQITEILWDRRDVNGNPLADAPFIRNIEVRIDGIGGRLYDADLSPDSTSHMPLNPVSWTNVSSIQMVYDDDAGNQYVSFWNRGAQPLQILTGTNLPSATVGNAYQTLFVGAGGTTPYTWSLQGGNLPSGLNLNGTGELHGNPSQAGTYNFTVRVTGSNQQTLQQTFTLHVAEPAANVSLQPRMRTPGRFELQVFGQAGQTYAIQHSTDLINWFPLLTTNAPADSFGVVDDTATDDARFYRVSRP